MRQTPAPFTPRDVLLRGTLAAALMLAAGGAQVSAAVLPSQDSPEVAQCRAGQADACAALIRQIRASAGTPPSPAQRCVTALQTHVLDQLDCRRGRASGCTAAAAHMADPACPVALDAAVRAQVGGADGGALPTEPVLDVGYWRAHLPRYPMSAFRAGVEGDVVLRVDVGADGRAIDVVVEHSAGNPHLDRAAKEALRTQPFLPAKAAGQPVIGRTRVTAPFVIGGRTLDTTRAVDLRSEPTAAASP